MTNLLEATKQELIDKSKDADLVKAYGTTRYERRGHQHAFDSITNFNKIDFNALFRANLLSFKVPVHGETNDYEVEVLFEGICDDIKKEIKDNKYNLEYKCVYRAIINAINRQDIYIGCNCKDFIYRQAYWASRGSYNGGKPESRPSNITNPNDTKGAGCKHVMYVLSNLDWAMKLATSIFNYIKFMEEEHEAKFVNIMFPKLFDISYNEYKGSNDKFITGDDELANAMDNEEDQDVVANVNKQEEEDGQELLHK